MINKNELSYILVDDDEDDRLIMRLALSATNRPLPVLEFSDGQELIDYLDDNAAAHGDDRMYWLIVLDVNMPRLNGLDTVRTLKSNPKWARLPVLMLSTSDDPSTVQQAMQNGASGYVVKPDTNEKFAELFDKFFAPYLNIRQTEWPETSAD